MVGPIRVARSFVPTRSRWCRARRLASVVCMRLRKKFLKDRLADLVKVYATGDSMWHLNHALEAEHVGVVEDDMRAVRRAAPSQTARTLDGVVEDNGCTWVHAEPRGAYLLCTGAFRALLKLF